MADMAFNTTSGQTIEREKLILYLNTGTTAIPVWSAIGKRVTDSSVEYDWSTETSTDIFGDVYTKVKKPTQTQTFDPCDLDAGDAAQLRIWNDAIKDKNITAMGAYDVLLVHLYAGTADSAMFAERYTSTTIVPTGLGGEGGGTIGMPIDVTFGGTRTVGTAAIAGGVVTFTASS